MKQLIWTDIWSYVFDATAKTITLSWIDNILLEQILIITNVTDNVIIYNFACGDIWGTILLNVITLDYDTTTMEDTDNLQIFIDYTSPLSTKAKQDEIITNQTDWTQKTEIQTLWKDVSVQNPIAADWDSVYEKDIWVERSISTGWTWDVVSPFNDLHSELINNSIDNPKIIFIHFRRTIYSNAIWFWSSAWWDFKNLEIEYIWSWEVVRYTDDSIKNDSTPRTSYLAESIPLAYNAIRLKFHTTDLINITNITIRKEVSVVARLKAEKPDWTIIDINATTWGNLKASIEEFDDTFYTNPLPVWDFYLLVAKWLIPWHSIINKFWQNPSLNSTTYEDIWDVWWTYIYPADWNADITHLWSDNALDIEPIEVQGLDINWTLTIQTITLTGTTRVLLTTPLWRIFRMKNMWSNDIVWKINTTNTWNTNIYSQIDNWNNQTLMALYTIPAWKTWYLLQWTNNLSWVTRAVAASWRLMMRPFWWVFQLKKTFWVNSEWNSFVSIWQPLPWKIAAKTDIKISALWSTNWVSLNTTFAILLVND